MPKLNLLVSDDTPDALTAVATAVGTARNGRASASALADMLASAWGKNPVAAAALFGQLFQLAEAVDADPEAWMANHQNAPLPIHVISADHETAEIFRQIISRIETATGYRRKQ